MCSRHSKKFVECLASLEKVCQGDCDGKSWKDGLDEAASIDECITHAQSTLFKQKGLKNKIQGFITDVVECRSHGQHTMFELFGFEFSHADLRKVDATIAQARATLAEGLWLQLLKANPSNPDKVKRTKIKEEAEWIGTQKVSTRLICPPLWAHVQKFMDD